jgi:hypothetical protein
MSSKLLTLSTARTELGRYVENGTCDADTINSRINEAIQRLILKPEMMDSPRLLHTVRISVCNREFALPRGVEKIIGVNINGVPTNVFNRMYQFMSSGPGDIDYRTWASMYTDLMDLGEAPFQFSIPPNEGAGYRLVAYSTSMNDMNVPLKLRGFGVQGKDVSESLLLNVFANGTEGTIEGSWDSQIISASAFRDLTAVSKPITSGYVTLYAVDTATNEMWIVGQYHPSDTLPMFRRYRITNKNCDTSSDRACTNLLALVLCGYTKLTEDDDIVPIDNLPALKNMIIAIEAENSGDLNKATVYESNAVRLLSEAKANHQITNSNMTIIDHDRYLMGSAINRRLI